MKLDPEQLAEYAKRPWAAMRGRKRAQWSENARRGGAEAGLRTSEMLWAHMRSVDPSWPGPRQRADDLAHHRALNAILDRLRHVVCVP